MPQVNDLTGLNHQLHLELEDSRATADAVKDELFRYTQNVVNKDHELEQVMREAKQTTVCTCRVKSLPECCALFISCTGHVYVGSAKQSVRKQLRKQAASRGAAA